MPIARAAPWNERDFERWFELNSLLPDGEKLLIVGSHQAIRRMVDLIAIDHDGGLVILEVKNESSNRKAIGQALEYLSQYDEVDLDELAEDYEDFRHGNLRADFRSLFGRDITLLSARRRVYLVAPSHDVYSAVCTAYLERHLQSDLRFHLLTATLDGQGFRLTEYQSKPFKRLGGLGRTFALNPRGRRLYHIIEPGAVPIVWNVGRWYDATGTLAVPLRPSRKLLRRARSHFLPLGEHHPQVDMSSSGSVWQHVSKRGREAILIGQVTAAAGKEPHAVVAFAEFRNGAFGTFRRRPADEFWTSWTRSGTAPRSWAELVALAHAKESAGPVASRPGRDARSARGGVA